MRPAGFRCPVVGKWRFIKYKLRDVVHVIVKGIDIASSYIYS